MGAQHKHGCPGEEAGLGLQERTPHGDATAQGKPASQPVRRPSGQVWRPVPDALKSTAQPAGLSVNAPSGDTLFSA